MTGQWSIRILLMQLSEKGMSQKVMVILGCAYSNDELDTAGDADSQYDIGSRENKPLTHFPGESARSTKCSWSHVQSITYQSGV